MEELTRTPEGHPAITVSVRVRYAECDPQGVAHHAAYPVWLEIARTELLRAMGKDYKSVEAAGLMCVVARMSLRYRRPAFYDDVLSVECVATKTRGVKLEHVYRVVRSDEVLTEAETTLVCVDREGRVRPVPEDWV
ncbi:MAG: thioesterase family protein [Planctomycetota bacterium]